MSNESNIRRDKHYIFKLHMHWVFVVDVPRSIFAEVCSAAQATRVGTDGEDDHAHFLVEYPPKLAVSSLVNSLNGVSGRLSRQLRPYIRKHC
jgi:putative transposase